MNVLDFQKMKNEGRKISVVNVVGEVANWLSASDEHLLGFEAAKARAIAWRN